MLVYILRVVNSVTLYWLPKLLDFSFLSCYQGIVDKVNRFGTARAQPGHSQDQNTTQCFFARQGKANHSIMS